MTPPKPLIELEEMKDWLIFKSKFPGMTKDTIMCTNILIAMEELKRLRAGQAREKILRDAVKEYQKGIVAIIGNGPDVPDRISIGIAIETQKKCEVILDQADAVKAGPSEARLEEEGPLLMALDNYEKYLVQIRGGTSSRKLDAAFAQFRDLLEEWINNDAIEAEEKVPT